MFCIFWAKTTFPLTLSRPRANAIMPESCPLTILMYSLAGILMVVVGASIDPSATFIVPSSKVTW